ncbi:MAG TPA: hypothetical protein ENK18_21825 [Deltaproteobacteria bacterium]|nr:hypothetical protein [Deltaproteobacteria bacterium]
MSFALASSQLAACGELSQERWAPRAAQVSCQTLRRCDPITYHLDYGSMDACLDATEVFEPTGCTYDPEAASRCIAAMRWRCPRIGRRYDQLLERCDAVWSCSTPPPSTPGTP